jgi:hypothetical protein
MKIFKLKLLENYYLMWDKILYRDEEIVKKQDYYIDWKLKEIFACYEEIKIWRDTRTVNRLQRIEAVSEQVKIEKITTKVDEEDDGKEMVKCLIRLAKVVYEQQQKG